MNERRATKRALLTSITALVMCVVMLAGTTFAWFTDTASTNVNKIQAGKLDVKLEMATTWDADGKPGGWTDAEGQTLNWVKATTGSGQATLWEPGAEYKLPELKIVNNGNLNLKYKVVITGASGDVDLLNVIDFSASITGTNNAVFSDVNVRDNNPVVYDLILTPNKTDVISLSGKMQTSANNTYMSKTISGISITVYAAQATGEYDSTSDQYDKDAAYPTVAPVLNLNTKQSVTLTNKGLPVTTIDEGGAVSTIPANTTMKNSNNDITGTEGEGTLERVIKTTIATNPATGVDTATYDISYNFTQNGTTTAVTEFSNIVTNEIQLASGLEIVAVTRTHDSNTTQMKPAKTENENTDGHFYYNKTTGKLTIWSKQYSAFAVSYKANFAAVVNGQFFNTLPDAVAAVSTDGTETTITLLNNAEVENYIAIKDGKNIVLDLNGHDVVHNGNYLFDVYNAKFHVTGEGTLFENVKDGYAPIIARGSATDTADYTVITIDKGVTLKGDYTGIFVAKDAGNGYHNYGLVINMFGTIDMGAVADGYHYSGMYVNGTNTVSDGNVMTINLDGATIKNCAGAGIYAAGYAKWNITNSSITGGDTGIEIRAGELTLNDCALEATAEVFSCDPNGNGATTEGAAIAIAQHTTKKDIAVTINGGSFKGVKALNESNPQNNDPDPQVELSIDGGTFIGDVSTADVTGFIKGGTFSSKPDNNYIAEGYTATEGSNGVWTVAKSTQPIT